MQTASTALPGLLTWRNAAIRHRRRACSGGVSVLTRVDGGALGGTRTPNLLIRRSMHPVRPVRHNPEPHVRICKGVRRRRHNPVLSGQSVREL
jgi:hypothetical protein